MGGLVHTECISQALFPLDGLHFKGSIASTEEFQLVISCQTPLHKSYTIKGFIDTYSGKYKQSLCFEQLQLEKK